jgi:hypothetical protein
MFRINLIIEKQLSEHGNHPYYRNDYFNRNDHERMLFGNAVQKMKDTVVPTKQEKIIKLMVQFIDNIFTLF